MQVKAPRGTYDILPDQVHKWHYVEEVLKGTAELYGYREVRTPIFEHTELFERGVGESTDIVTKEMYTFSDKSNRSLTLRPEGTASCARAIIEHSLYNGLLPVKWYYTGPMFRYDRPQTGRYRQFHQFGVEAFGSTSPYLDAEVILLLVEILNRLGLSEFELHLNSVGCPSCREEYRHKLIQHITPVKDGLCKDCQVRYRQNPLRVLDCKVATCHEAITGYPTLSEYLCGECRDHYAIVRETLEQNGVKYVHDDNLVRGLDYYTKTAFEVHIPDIGAQSAIGGGGRYDGLVRDCGGPDLPGIGFALGIERLLLAVESLKSNCVKPVGIEAFVTVMDDKYELQAARLVNELRQAGIRTDKDYSGKSARAQMKYAAKLGSYLTLFVGDEEINGDFITIRDMQSKKQEQVARDHITDHVKLLLQNY